MKKFFTFSLVLSLMFTQINIKTVHASSYLDYAKSAIWYLINKAGNAYY